MDPGGVTVRQSFRDANASLRFLYLRNCRLRIFGIRVIRANYGGTCCEASGRSNSRLIIYRVVSQHVSRLLCSDSRLVADISEAAREGRTERKPAALKRARKPLAIRHDRIMMTDLLS